LGGAKGEATRRYLEISAEVIVADKKIDERAIAEVAITIAIVEARNSPAASPPTPSNRPIPSNR